MDVGRVVGTVVVAINRATIWIGLICGAREGGDGRIERKKWTSTRTSG